MNLSFDASTTSTGYAIFDDGVLVEKGLIRSKKKDAIERIAEIYDGCRKIFSRNIYDYVFIEDVPLSSVVNRRVAENLLLLQGTILSLCIERGCQFVQMEPNNWRKLSGLKAGRKREEQKKAAIELVNKLYGFDYKWIDGKHDTITGDSDVCEAILIGIAGIKKVGA